MDFESGDGYVYDIFKAVIDVVFEEKSKKIQLAKCMICNRLNSFRPNSKGMQFTALYCKYCGGIISFGSEGKDPKINESAKIFCENCKNDCRKCQINRLANEKLCKNGKQQ